jgi:hypothetical protein
MKTNNNKQKNEQTNISYSINTLCSFLKTNNNNEQKNEQTKFSLSINTLCSFFENLQTYICILLYSSVLLLYSKNTLLLNIDFSKPYCKFIKTF